MFSFRSLGSGSSGNAYLFGTDEGYFLIDAGVGIRALNKYLFEMGLTAGKLAAIFLTHDHCDHAKNAGNLQRAAAKMGHELTVYTTPPTVRGIDGNPTIRYKPNKLSFWRKRQRSLVVDVALRLSMYLTIVKTITVISWSMAICVSACSLTPVP